MRLAALNNHREVVALLLDKGADPNQPEKVRGAHRQNSQTIIFELFVSSYINKYMDVSMVYIRPRLSSSTFEPFFLTVAQFHCCFTVFFHFAIKVYTHKINVRKKIHPNNYFF